MNILRILGDGLILAALLLGAELLKDRYSEKSKAIISGAFILGLLFEILEVYFIYRHQENSDLFFWHAYLSWTLGNIIFIITRAAAALNKKSFYLERIALWQVVVIPIFSGFSLSVGWLMKLYIR